MWTDNLQKCLDDGKLAGAALAKLAIARALRQGWQTVRPSVLLISPVRKEICASNSRSFGR